MTQALVPTPTLFEIIDIFGKRIRTTERWWLHIVTEKHEEMRDNLDVVKATIAGPDEVRQSEENLNGEGFLMTAYLTSKAKKKGVLVWQKKSNG